MRIAHLGWILLIVSSWSHAQVLTGLDVLEQNHFAALKNLRVGIITNQTGVDRNGHTITQLLKDAPDVKVVAIFSPEHGLFGVKDEKVEDSVDPATGLKVYSLYGKNRKPTTQMVAKLDALVYDIQDVGARFYTYSATLGLCMEAAAQYKLKFFVLDRPNPIASHGADGPIADKSRFGFTAYGPMPVTHGLTFGELAGLYNNEWNIHCDLTVIPMQNWKRSMWWDETQLPWTRPSPAMTSPTTALLYPGVCLLEQSNVSVGRGTPAPFEQFGAPWIDEIKLTQALTDLHLPGVAFSAAHLSPTSSKFKDESIPGVKITVTDRNAVEPVQLGASIVWTLHKLFPGQFKSEGVDVLFKNKDALTKLLALDDPHMASSIWADDLARFNAARQKYFIYP